MNATLTIVRFGGRIDALAVKFTDSDGSVVSLAFDVRPVSTNGTDEYNYATFEVLRDCPVLTNDGAKHDVSDLPVLLNHKG